MDILGEDENCYLMITKEYETIENIKSYAELSPSFIELNLLQLWWHSILYILIIPFTALRVYRSIRSCETSVCAKQQRKVSYIDRSKAQNSRF